MVHKFFSIAANNSDPIDKIAPVGRDGRRFSSNFRVLFPHNGEFSPEAESWLDAITAEFNLESRWFSEVNQLVRAMEGYELILSKLRLLFEIEEALPKHSIDFRTLEFWIYLLWAHSNIQYRDHVPERNDNIMEFILRFKIHETRVVMLGHEPPEQEPSAGFAYHASRTPSSYYLVSNLNTELNLLAKWGSPDLQIRPLYDPSRWFIGLKGLDYWIKQKVLLLNSRLTYRGHTHHKQTWRPLVETIIQSLSRNCENVVFILTGFVASFQEDLIDQSKHKVINVYHPSKMGIKNPDLDWSYKLPFINTNFYFHQKRKRLIDWNHSRDVPRFALLEGCPTASVGQKLPREYGLGDFFAELIRYGEQEKKKDLHPSFQWSVIVKDVVLEQDLDGLWSLYKIKEAKQSSDLVQNPGSPNKKSKVDTTD